MFDKRVIILHSKDKSYGEHLMPNLIYIQEIVSEMKMKTRYSRYASFPFISRKKPHA
jgi:hypothetical protein